MQSLASVGAGGAVDVTQDPSGAARDSANGPDFALVVGTTVTQLDV